ncbi:putative membrane protein [[Clostridium] cellulosi]|uniref:Putative membrane protein n=1 Tax=[Clostridium] cellulosi TaxID=29343 RepID=A0A078KN60_9FIRM|nr:putative membrane protein [[Clostridium] cellulosi]
MNKIFLIAVIIFMTMLGALGGFFFKRSSAGGSILSIIKNKELYIGGIIYIASALLNIWVLKYMQYSVVLPMTAITYIWTMIISRIVLKEKITVKKAFGVASIIVGAVFLSM